MTDETEEVASESESYTWDDGEGCSGTYIFPHGATAFCAANGYDALRIVDGSGDLEQLTGSATWQAGGRPSRPTAVKPIKPA
jgi:hypothetical protein